MTYPKRPSPFVILATHQGTLITNKNDYRMIDATRGYGVGWQLFNQSCFDPDEVGVALKLLGFRRTHFGDGVVGLDLGANLGVHTIEWGKTMYGWGQVIAVEAQERIYYALAGNIAINNCFNARAIHGAIGSEEGVLDIPVPDYLQPASFGSLELRQTATSEFIGQTILPERNQRVRMLTIDSLQLPRLDFIKIDVEGMELEALAGGRATIDQHKPVMLIESIKTDKVALLKFLEERNYKTFPLGINMLAVHTSDPTLSQISVTN
jgi:FkbM family methyltransferase